MSLTTTKPRVLLTNDDGPPSAESPYIYGLYRHLTQDLGWDVKVVVPSSQKSWIGKAFHITEITKGRYYYPKEPHGKGEVSNTSRPLKEGEIAEWILLDGTPATCANVALHNIYHGQIDLVISGPNLGRNTSSAFALSSGTIGAAMSSSLSKVRSIALSYGTVLRPTPVRYFDPAHQLSLKIISYLWNNWGHDEGGLKDSEVDLYNVNIPLIQGLLEDEGLKICWTRIWRNSYGRLFKAVPAPGIVQEQTGSAAGPNSLAPPSPNYQEEEDKEHLVFKFSPDMTGLINPSLSDIPVGSDGWAMHKGWVSVTPLRATFGEPFLDNYKDAIDVEDRVWKL